MLKPIALVGHVHILEQIYVFLLLIRRVFYYFIYILKTFAMVVFWVARGYLYSLFFDSNVKLLFIPLMSHNRKANKEIIPFLIYLSI